MLTIDWKERLNKDTDDYLQTKLPNRDYDFEIIFIAYPERVNGKIPNEVIVHVANTILQRLGKTHEQYQSFFRYLWTKKGEYGKLAFTQMMSKLLPKKPGLYFPMLEEYLKSANQQELSSVMDKVMLPLLRKSPEKYLDYLYTWSKADNPLLRKLAMNTAIKLIKKVPELTGQVFMHYQHQWYYPLGDMQSEQITLIKALPSSTLSFIARSFWSSKTIAIPRSSRSSAPLFRTMMPIWNASWKTGPKAEMPRSKKPRSPLSEY